MAKVEYDLRSVFPVLDEMQDRNLAAAVVSVWQKVWEKSGWQNIREVSFSPGVTGPTLVGHTRAVLDHALAIVHSLRQVHKRDVPVDWDRLVAGCILHDVDKLLILAPDGQGGCVLAENARQYQHGFYSAYYAEQEGLPPEIVNMLQAHTSYSRIMPSTLEGVILYCADMADADVLKYTYGKTPSVLKAIGKVDRSQ